MEQVMASFEKTLKEFLREKATLFWTIAWPIIWVLISSFSFVRNAPENVISHVRGSITISLTTFAITIAGMANLPGNIARDRERGLLAKLKSMPVNPWKDFMGRIIGLLSFSFIAAVMVILVGIIVCGATFSGSIVSIFQSIGFFFIIFLASAGIGLLAGTLIKHVQGAIMTGVGISVITASISGLFAPYSSLPDPLKAFSRIYPISSANSSVIYLLVGEWYAGYNPLNASQMLSTVSIASLLFVIGLMVYSKFWRLLG